MTASLLKSRAFFDLEIELNNTRTLLDRVPEEQFSWKPHAKSFSLGELATHVANLGTWMLMTITEDGFDLASSSGPDEPAENHEALMSAFEEKAEALMQAFENATDETLEETWTLRHGTHEIFSAPKANVLRQWGISHLIHHRAQLTVYLRELGVALPPIYGPTADEQA